MNARAEWLSVGHIPHGYRRVFALYEDQTLRHVVNLAPMPYEQVYQVREQAHDIAKRTGSADIQAVVKADAIAMADPSLWWGLSLLVQLVECGLLLGPTNPDHADDGYIQVRPELLLDEQMLPLAAYQQAVSDGRLILPARKEGNSVG